jgi:hypothetical protein
MKTATNTLNRTIQKGIGVLVAGIFLLSCTAQAKSHKVMAGPNFVAEAALLAPAVPGEADFNDIPPIPMSLSPISFLAPVTPMEASFSDTVPDNPLPVQMIRSFAPVNPGQADFMDTILPNPLEGLTPFVPWEAMFMDGI